MTDSLPYNIPPIQFFDEIDSTNALALQNSSAPHGSCWVADSQTAGRGRRQSGGQRKAWHSPRNTNIYMSVLLRPTIELSQASGLTLAAGAGICDALIEQTGLDIWLKWPNDLYIGSRKLAGILTEASTTGMRLDAIVVGVGINVNLTADAIPEELRSIMTTIAIEAGRQHDRLSLLVPIRNAILKTCDAYCEAGFVAILPALRRLDRSDGRTVELLQHSTDPGHAVLGHTSRGSTYGTARGIGPEGQLYVELDNGQRLEVITGEVRFV